MSVLDQILALIPVQKRMDLLEDHLGRELLRILEEQDLTPVFQPLVDVQRQEIFAYEALIRGPVNSPMFYPLNLFAVAEKFDLLDAIDYLARHRALMIFAESATEEICLFVNAMVSSLLKGSDKTGLTRQMIVEYGLKPSQVVIEVTEHQPISDWKYFVQTIKHYRDQGFKVAIDDLGGGYNALRLWSEIKPDFVKIDKHFVENLANDMSKHRFIETLLRLSNNLEGQLIVEGVETSEQLAILERLGVSKMQGFLFRAPENYPPTSLDFNWPKTPKSQVASLQQAGHLHGLIHHKEKISPHTSTHDVLDIFLKNDQWDYLAVVENSKVLGMVWRKDLTDLMASRFGRDLHMRKPIHKLMDKNPISVEIDSPLENLSRMVTDRRSQARSSGMVHHAHGFILTHNQAYVGVGDVYDLLKVMTDLQVETARHANPLSGLPGNVPIQNTLRQWLLEKKQFVVVYVDLDNFKPYNDYYSYDDGDRIITLLSKILLSAVPESSGFVGHIGGDDFMILLDKPKKLKSLLQGILQNFHLSLKGFYKEEDWQKSGIQAKDREGRKVFFPLMSLSLGVLVVHTELINHPQQIASLATQAKKEAKKQSGNSWVILDSKEMLQDITPTNA